MKELKEKVQDMEARVAEAEGFKEALMIENVSLNEKVNKLVDDLSEKEAKWCETEEQMNQRVSTLIDSLPISLGRVERKVLRKKS